MGAMSSSFKYYYFLISNYFCKFSKSRVKSFNVANL